MKTRGPTYIVVDANVARAAGSMDGPTPAPECVSALTTLQEDPAFHLAFDETLEAEWDIHQSKFAAKLRFRMFTKERVHLVAGTWGGHNRLLDEAKKHLPDALSAIAHDAHLPGIAHRTGRRVLSLDNRQRGYLATLSRHFADLQRIQWAAPDGDGVLEWLAAGAPDGKSHEHYRLTPPPP